MQINDPSLLAEFVAEVRGLVPGIRDALAAAETATDLAEALEPAYRHAHNIAGTASLLTMMDLSQVAAELESALEKVREDNIRPDDATFDVFRAATDTIALAIDELAARLAGPPAEEPEPEEEADQVSPELLEVFTLEAQDHLTTIQSLLVVLREQPGNKRTLLEIRRAAHTLKGAASVVGIRAVTKLSHRMEDLLDWYAEGSESITPELVDLLVQSADGLENLTSEKADKAGLRDLYQRYEVAMASLHTVRQPDAAAPAEVEPEPEPEPEAPIEEPTEPEAALPRAGEQMVRIPLERLDSLVKLVGELIMSRTAFEQRTGDFLRLVGELRLSADRLRRSSGKLDSEYEARALAVAGDDLSEGAGLGQLATFQTHGFDELEFDRYTDFHLLTRELAETTIDLQTVGHEFGNLNGDFDGFLTRQARLTSELQDKMMRIRMVPLATLASRLHRTVRTTARTVGKQVDLVLEGEGTELDKTVLEAMADPLLHLLRNAVDHGIETPEVRTRRGKSPRGTIRLRASTEGTQVVVKLQDDGGGFDFERIRMQAVARGLASASDVVGLAERDLLSFLFMAGFSTATELSEVSGRGVGLDIVKAQVHKFKGTIDADSQPGRGTTFTIRLPLTLAVLRALLVRANGQVFAIPLSCVDQILRADTERDHVGQEQVVRVGKKVYPLVSLAERLHLKETAGERIERPPVVLLRAGEQEVALVVDELVGGREIVLKNLGEHLRRVHGFSGATLLGDGSVVLVIAPNELLGEPQRATIAVGDTSSTANRGRQTLNVLVVDDSPSVRRVVSDLLRNAGMNPIQAKDGLDALEVLHRVGALPDVVLTDIEMPRMDGYELLSTLRADARLRNIPVVVITSRAGDRHRRKAMDLGATSYLVKPYPEETLLRAVRELAQLAAV